MLSKYLCHKTLSMALTDRDGKKIVSFKSGKKYQQCNNPNSTMPLALRDEQGHYHELSEWQQLFTKATKNGKKKTRKAG